MSFPKGAQKKSDVYLLVIDDEKDFLSSMDFWFKSQGYSVKAVTSGVEALLLLKKKMPSIIFLNVQMPQGEGIRTLQEIRALSKDVPVIMLSAFGAEEMRLEAYKLGVNGFFDKSSNFYEAQHLINSLVRVVSYKNRIFQGSKPSGAKKNIIRLLIVLFVFLSILFAILQRQLSFGSVCLKGKCLRVELALTEKERERGLMNRRYLAGDCGMLFVFEREGFWPFWMKDTLIPLDIIWMDKKGKVIDIVKGAKPVPGGQMPTSYNPAVRAKFVLETNAGFVEENHIKVGDQAAFK